MNKAIKDDFNYREELKSCFDVPFEAVQDLIFNQDRFSGIYHKETILDPDYEFDNEVKEQVKNPISSDSVWFELENGHAREIGNDNDLINCQTLFDVNYTHGDDVHHQVMYAYLLLDYDMTKTDANYKDLFNDDVTNYLKHRNLNIDDCTVIGDISEFNDQYSNCKWFIVDNGSQNIYIYQDWDQVWENIIYDLLPGKWLKDFASK